MSRHVRFDELNFPFSNPTGAATSLDEISEQASGAQPAQVHSDSVLSLLDVRPASSTAPLFSQPEVAQLLPSSDSLILHQIVAQLLSFSPIWPLCHSPILAQLLVVRTII